MVIKTNNYGLFWVDISSLITRLRTSNSLNHNADGFIFGWLWLVQPEPADLVCDQLQQPSCCQPLTLLTTTKLNTRITDRQIHRGQIDTSRIDRQSEEGQIDRVVGGGGEGDRSMDCSLLVLHTHTHKLTHTHTNTQLCSYYCKQNIYKSSNTSK